MKPLPLLLTTIALLGASACSKKPPPQLPPSPDASPDQEWNAEASREDDLNALRNAFRAEAGSDTVYFDTDSYGLDTTSRSILDAQARWLLQHPRVQVTVEGHCDERGTREYNLALGERRANAAKNYLAARGVPARQMTVLSWGKERPVAVGSNEDEWAKNRRAVTLIVAAQ